MAKEKARRISAIVALIDTTTYKDSCSEEPVDCVVMVTEYETGDGALRFPRVQLSDRILQAGPETVAEYVREELSGKVGFAIDEPLFYREQLTESRRSFLVFTGTISFTVATDSYYASVQAKSLAELRFFRDKAAPMHYKIAERLLTKSA